MAGIRREDLFDWDLSDIADEAHDDQFGVDNLFEDEDADIYGDDATDDEDVDSFGDDAASEVLEDHVGLFSDAAYEADEDEDSFGRIDAPPGPRNRRELARTMRRFTHGKTSEAEGYGVGYGHGYVRALVDSGKLTEKQARTVYGNPGLMKNIFNLGRTIGAGGAGSETPAQPGLLGQVLTGVGEGAGLDVGPGVAGRVGRHLGGQLGEAGILPEWLRKQKPKTKKGAKKETEAEAGPKAPAAGAAVEAGPEQLPPTYVAESDETLHEDVLQQAPEGGVSVSEAGETSDSFGASAQHGFLNGFPRATTKRAAQQALTYGSLGLKRADLLEPAVLIEDTEAQPMLFSDGAIWEPAYGAMAAVPCPSCHQVSYGAVQQGQHHRCLVCSGYGAILVPASDLGHVKPQRYGIIPLLIAGALAFGAGGLSGLLFPQKMAQMDALKKKAKKLANKKRKAHKSKAEATKDVASEIIAQQAGSGAPVTPEIAHAVASAAVDDVETEDTTPSEHSSQDAESDIAEIEKMGLIRAIIPGRLASSVEPYGYAHDDDDDDEDAFGLFLDREDLFTDDED